jgi:hypothetical protein
VAEAQAAADAEAEAEAEAEVVPAAEIVAAESPEVVAEAAPPLEGRWLGLGLGLG